MGTSRLGWAVARMFFPANWQVHDRRFLEIRASPVDAQDKSKSRKVVPVQVLGALLGGFVNERCVWQRVAGGTS